MSKLRGTSAADTEEEILSSGAVAEDQKNSATILWRLLATGGPGLVFLVASVGPRDLVSNSVAGSNYGYSLIWTLLLIGVARFIILEATARYVIATGESLLSGFHRVGSWTAWLILGAILVKRHLSNLYHVLLMGLALGLLAGFEGPVYSSGTSLASCALAFSVMYAGGYRAVERWSKPLALLLVAPLLLAAVWSKPDPGTVFEGIFLPAIPQGGEPYGPALAVLLLIAAGVESISNLKYSAYIYEKGWRDPSHLRKQRLDLLASLVGLFLVSALLQVTAATVLRPAGLRLERAEDLVPIFTSVLGPAGKVAMSVGLWVVVFTTYMGSNMGYSLIAADIVVGRQKPENASASAGFERRRRQVYRWFLVAFCVSPLYVIWTDWKPVPIIVLSLGLMALALPAVVLILLRLTADRSIMGEYANNRLASAAMILVVVTTLFVAYRTGVEFLGTTSDST